MSTIIYSAKLAIFSTSYMHVAGSAFAYIQKQFSVTANYNGKTLKAENQTSVFDGSSTFVELSLQSVPAFVNYASNAVTSASNYGKLNV